MNRKIYLATYKYGYTENGSSATSGKGGGELGKNIQKQSSQIILVWQASCIIEIQQAKLVILLRQHYFIILYSAVASHSAFWLPRSQIQFLCKKSRTISIYLKKSKNWPKKISSFPFVTIYKLLIRWYRYCLWSVEILNSKVI